MIGRTRARGLVAGLLALLLTPAVAPAQTITIPIDALRDWKFYNDAGWRALGRDDYPLAESRLREAIKILRPFDGDGTSARRLLARSYTDLAWVLHKQGRTDEAAPLARWALTVREAQPDVKPEILYQTLSTLAQIERAGRRYADAEAHLRRALTVQEASLGPDQVDTTRTLEDLADLYAEQRKYAAAEPLYRQALALRSKALPPDHPDLAETLEHYAALLRRVGRDDEAGALEARARTVRADLEERLARLKAERAQRVPVRPGPPPGGAR